jgi:hypothetical protein
VLLLVQAAAQVVGEAQGVGSAVAALLLLLEAAAMAVVLVVEAALGFSPVAECRQLNSDAFPWRCGLYPLC